MPAPLPTVQIIWFRRDLRLNDHFALSAAAANPFPTLALVLDEEADDAHHSQYFYKQGSASKGWWQRSLHALQASLLKLHIPLLYFPFPLKTALTHLQNHLHLAALFCHRYEEPHLAARDQSDATLLQHLGIPHQFFSSHLLFSPGEIITTTNKPYLIFTSFWKRCLQLLEFNPPLPVPTHLIGASLPQALHSYMTLPKPCKTSWEFYWKIGEENTHHALDRFLTQQLATYEQARNFPALSATSHMSAPLHFGEITPRYIFYAARNLLNTDAFFKEIGWREFAYHMLHFFPQLPFQSLDKKMIHFPYRNDQAQLKAWQEGRTGYPIVDAGMRELTSRGTMHNRVRMIVSSFLTKDLLLPWQEGASWFWEHLVDADLASNSLNWQWVAGSGINPQPFFRIFNPVLQGKTFDPEGHYIRTFVPELAALPNKWIHTPWQANPSLLKSTGLELGRHYPFPLVDHILARTRALSAYRTLKNR